MEYHLRVYESKGMSKRSEPTIETEIEPEKLSEQLIEWMTHTHTHIQIDACEYTNTWTHKKHRKKKLYENEFVLK